MSGHNKWSQIKHRKGAVDQKRSKLFSILARVIAVEAKKTHGDRNSPGLRTAIEKARAANLPNENIDRAITNATGANAENLQEVLYEAYGPGGVAILINGITANKNRTSQEIKHILTGVGASLAAPGAAAWAFADGKPTTTIPSTPELKKQIGNLVELLEEHEEVQTVSINLAG